MFQTDGPLMRAQQPAFQQRDDTMDARQQFRRVALAAQDRDLTSVVFAVEGEVAQPTIRMHNTAGLARARNAAAILCFPHNGDSETLPASAPGKDNHDKLPPIG